MVAAAVEAEYNHICEKAVAGWQRHGEYEEILATAYLEVWTMIARLPPEEREKAHARVCWLAKKAPGRHLRSPGCNSQIRNRNARQEPLAPMVSLDWLLGQRGLPGRATTRDFAPGLVEWLWRQWVREELIHTLSARDLDLLVRVLWLGRSFAAVARTDGQCKTAVRTRFLRVLARARSLFDEQENSLPCR